MYFIFMPKWKQGVRLMDIKSDPTFAKADTTELLSVAAAIRDRFWGQNVTYSRKVFVPLTKCAETPAATVLL